MKWKNAVVRSLVGILTIMVGKLTYDSAYPPSEAEP